MAIPIVTLRNYLDDKKWHFFEKGMNAIWNELDQLADALNTAQLGSGVAFGTIDLVANCAPDVLPQTPQSGRQTNTSPPAAQAPPTQFR